MTLEPRAPGPSPTTRCTALVASQVAVLVALLAAATRAPFAGVPWLRGLGRWLAAAAPVDGVAVVTHRLALVVSAALLAGTLLHLAAALTRVPALVRATTWAAVPGARRAVAALVLTAGVVAPTPARAADDRAGPTTVRDGRAPAVVVVTTAPAPAPVPAVAHTVLVQPGDSLWTISERIVAAEQGTEADVAARWAAICEANAARLPSGDPSLLQPGDEVVVPE